MRIPKKALLLAVQRGLDVVKTFSTTLYTGNGSTQTITNGIDLAGEGGLVWIKSRSAATDHQLFDTNRGVANELASNSTAAQVADADTLTAFNVDGFNIGADSNVNTGSATYASWTFRQAPKFFDIVTWTGNGGATRVLNHSLGVVPGFYVVKRLDLSDDWYAYHRSPAGTVGGILNGANAFTAGFGIHGTPTDSTITLNTTATDVSGATYIAYLFAHDPSDSGIIQCGSYTGNGSSSGPVIDLGWQPQWLLIKSSTSPNSWAVYDNERDPTNPRDSVLSPNISNSEVSDSSVNIDFNSNGFELKGNSGAINSNGNTYVFMAIRAPE